jgi:hypothetical protein
MSFAMKYVWKEVCRVSQPEDGRKTRGIREYNVGLRRTPIWGLYRNPDRKCLPKFKDRVASNFLCLQPLKPHLQLATINHKCLFLSTAQHKYKQTCSNGGSPLAACGGEREIAMVKIGK